MGRGKIEIKKIENPNSRQVTFSKRRGGLLKKAHELAVLCDADVAVIIFSNTGKLFEYSSSSMKKILTRYNKCLDSTKAPELVEKPEKVEPKEVDVLKEEIEMLKLKEMRLLGKDLMGVSMQELRALEQQLNEGILCIKERKEQILIEQIAQSRMHEQRVILENETLRRQVDELRGFFPLNCNQAPLCIEFHAMGKNTPTVNEGSGSPETACNGTLVHEDSDTTLHLGPPSGICRKRKTPEGEIQSSNSENEVGPQ
ncbi:hypothetical protein ACJIZ3_007708 [Penstemon smallii]|uniref:Agamous-like MADS-box protein AGL15 n=1 Tax=Penstemon smallii TaxID=265156 RepID=A0ABD3T9E8_9LAMI